MMHHNTAIVDCGKVVYSDRTKSESSRRRLPLTPMLHKMLRAEWRKQAENQLRMGTGYHREGFVCCWPDGSPMLPEYVSNHYRKVLKDSELPFIQFRNLRDTAATILHRQGFDAKSIQGWLGHADASTTANIYIHAQEVDMQDMASAVEGALKQA